jgi:prepilin-type N-terminal cleavage/methylation domain-containing protein
MDGYVHDPHWDRRGVSLLELLVATAVVALLAALAAVPAIQALRATREARAIANLKTIASAEMTHYTSRQRFGVFDELLRDGDLPRQFERAATGGGLPGSATETISDGTYVYAIRYALDASGITIDADPTPPNAPSYRRFRVRLGRVASGKGGSECTLLVADPSVKSPPARAYRPLAGS